MSTNQVVPNPEAPQELLAVIQNTDHFVAHIMLRDHAPRTFYSPNFPDAVTGVASLLIELLTQYPDTSSTITLAQVFVPPSEIRDRATNLTRPFAVIELDSTAEFHPGVYTSEEDAARVEPEVIDV